LPRRATVLRSTLRKPWHIYTSLIRQVIVFQALHPIKK
jgi:hypothetical protein